MKLFKYSAAFTAAFSMAIAPLAQGAEAKVTAKAVAEAKLRLHSTKVNYNVDKKAVQDFLKYTGLNTKKRMTVGEFHSKMRPYYPRTLRAQMDEWARINRNELMPEFQASTYKDSEGKERVRLMMTKDGQTITASYNPDDNAKFVKVNNVFLTKDDIKYHEQAIRKIVHGNKPIKDQMNKTKPKSSFKTSILLGYEEYSRLTAKERATYLVKVRYVLENAERVMSAYYGKQAANNLRKEFFVQWLLLEEANAAGKSVRGAQPGDPCIVAGYLATYGDDFSCGGTGTGRAKLVQEMNQWGGGRCTNGTVSCNPLVYGFNSNGSAICVKNAGRDSAIYNSTSQACPNASPLRKGTANELADKKRIIESYLNAKDPETLKKLGVDGLSFKDGKIPKDQYDLIAQHLSDLNSYIDKATTACSVMPLSEIQKVRDEQQSACQALALRKIELDSYPTTVVLLPPTTPPTVSACGEGGPDNPRNSEFVNGKCVCRAGDEMGSITEDGKEMPACIPVAGVVTGDDGKDECNKDQQPNPNAKEGEDSCKKAAGACTWCKWLIGGLVFAGVAGLIWWMTRDKDKDKDKKTDPDPCPPAPLICSPVVPTPTTPTPVPTVPPIQPPPVVDPDPIPTPAVTPFVESTTGTSTSTSGGVR